MKFSRISTSDNSSAENFRKFLKSSNIRVQEIIANLAIFAKEIRENLLFYSIKQGLYPYEFSPTTKIWNCAPPVIICTVLGRV